MKKILYTSQGKRYMAIMTIWLFINFFTMIGLSLKMGSMAFPAGDKDDKGYYTMDHGKRYEFDKTSFYISYWQGAVTWISFPLCFFVTLLLDSKGHIKEIY